MSSSKSNPKKPSENRKRSTAAAMERCKRRRNTDPTDSPGKGSSVKFAPHPRIESLLVGDDSTLYTRNLVPGEALYGENLLSIQNDDGTEVEYRHWDPSRSKLAAAILCGAQNIWMIQEECGTTVSHISDLVGPDGMVYVIGMHNPKDFLHVAEKRFNIVPIIANPTYSMEHRMLICTVDVLFASAEALDETNCIDSENRLRGLIGQDHIKQFKAMEKVSLGSFDESHVYVIGGFRTPEMARAPTPASIAEVMATASPCRVAPTYFVFESCSGYALFLTHHLREVERGHLENIEYFINRIDEVVKLIAFHPFKSIDFVFEEYKAVSKGQVMDTLMKFLLEHLPKKPANEEEYIRVAVSNPFMTLPIARETKLHITSGITQNDIMRGLRMHINKFIKDINPENLGKVQREIALRSFSQV